MDINKFFTSSIIYRFTPPTCTLEIIARKLPLVRWSSSNILKQHWFRLKFDDPRQMTSNQVTIEGSQRDLVKLITATEQYVRVQMQGFSLVDNLDSGSKTIGLKMPYLKPQGLVHHELFLGCLAHNSDRRKIKLGTVQLFDLATALEAYQTKMAASLVLVGHRSQPTIGLIGGGIAAVAVAATAIAISNLPEPQKRDVIVRNQPQPSEILETDKITPPVKPSTKRQTTNPKLTEPLSATKRLPPPPAVETPKPKPNIPDPAEYSLSKVGRQSGLNNPAQKLSRDSSGSVEPNRSQESVATIMPADTEAVLTVEEPESSANFSGHEQYPTAQRQSVASRRDDIMRADALNPFEVEGEALQERDFPKNTAPHIRSLHQVEPSLESKLPTEDTVASSDRLEAKKSSLQRNELGQVKAFFQDKWQPPADLKQSLEYRLFLNKDGSLARVIPLGKASQYYLDRTLIPTKGEALISPVSNPPPSPIRLLLNPDGKVQAFIE